MLNQSASWFADIVLPWREALLTNKTELKYLAKNEKMVSSYSNY